MYATTASSDIYRKSFVQSPFTSEMEHTPMAPVGIPAVDYPHDPGASGAGVTGPSAVQQIMRRHAEDAAVARSRIAKKTKLPSFSRTEKFGQQQFTSPKARIPLVQRVTSLSPRGHPEFNRGSFDPIASTPSATDTFYHHRPIGRVINTDINSPIKSTDERMGVLRQARRTTTGKDMKGS